MKGDHKTMKKTLGLLMGILTMLVFSTTVYATGNSVGNAGENYCNVSFYITDETADGYPGSKFTATWTDTAGTSTGQYDFTKGNSWGNSSHTVVVTIEAPITYSVEFSGLEDGYKIVNTLDLSEDITFETISGGTASVYWSIFDIDNTTGTIGGTSDNSTIEITTESQILNQSENGNRVIENEEAEEVYQKFLSAVSYIADSDEWYSALLIQYEWFGEASYAPWYAEYVEGGTEEEFLSMSLFDRFVWVETYLRYAWAVGTDSYSTYFGSHENFESHITNNIVNMINNAADYEAVEEAYLALAEWQYDYVIENGYPFNFVNNRSYLDEGCSLPESTTETGAETDTDDAELEEVREELMAELSEEEIAELTGDTETTEEANSTSSGGMGMVIVLIIVVVVIGGGAFLFLRKKK